MSNGATVNAKGALRTKLGHPWIFRSDVIERPSCEAGVVRVRDNRNRDLGWALWSPQSEISLRVIERDSEVSIDADWWHATIGSALSRRAGLEKDCSAFRLVHGEGDGIPSLVCDRYDRWLVVQLMSAGLERFRDEIVDALRAHTHAEGILARNDAALRSREGLARETVLLHGDVPREVEVEEHGIAYLAAPWTGQKTGAFLDQRANRKRIGELARGRSLDCFSYHGSFALHLAKNSESVIAIDSSARALDRAGQNARLNAISNIEFVEADAFDWLTERQKAGDRFDTIVLDPPAFAKTRAALPAGIRGYKDVNMRAMKLMAKGGFLFTASCSFHMTKQLFLEMLESAAADSGRRIALREIRGQPLDHPEVLTIPETSYLKGAILEAME